MTLIITPQRAYPSIFDLQTVKQYLKIDDNNDDNIINIIIDYAINYAQKITNTLISQDIYDIYVCDIQNNQIKLNLKPISNINTIEANGMQLDSGTEYIIENNCIIFNNSTTECRINLLGGYTSLALLPPELKMAILMHISAAYDNRSGTSQAVPFAVNNIYNKIAKLRISFNN
jgi:hypothetical protein